MKFEGEVPDALVGSHVAYRQPRAHQLQRVYGELHRARHEDSALGSRVKSQVPRNMPMGHTAMRMLTSSSGYMKNCTGPRVIPSPDMQAEWSRIAVKRARCSLQRHSPTNQRYNADEGVVHSANAPFLQT